MNYHHFSISDSSIIESKCKNSQYQFAFIFKCASVSCNINWGINHEDYILRAAVD